MGFIIESGIRIAFWVKLMYGFGVILVGEGERGERRF